ncbi:alpha/beta fold hydrolase [Haloarchaeobius amylolyticus]|uniref:Alpha/beta fold hydrolase n=1 Tax=Haloarchaeobius amylolyticus TaxID=1198296 RepID=A0ABD6BBP1_9EURY
MWDALELRSPLAEHFTVYAMDRRGHGESGDNELYEIERVFEDVVAVVDVIGEPVTLLGFPRVGSTH